MNESTPFQHETLQRTLRESDWSNLRMVNRFRAVIWGTIALTYTAIAADLPGAHDFPVFAGAWALLVLLSNEAVLRWHYRSAAPWVFATLDVFILYLAVDGEFLILPDLAQPLNPEQVRCIGLGFMVILSISVLHSSWRLALWIFALGAPLYLAILERHGLSGLISVVDIVLLLGLGVMLVYASVRHRQLNEKVVGTLSRITQERLAAENTIVAGLTHEMNTPLGVLSSNAATLLRCIERLECEHDESARRKALRAIRSVTKTSATAFERLARIVRRLKTIARLDEAAVQDRVDLNREVEAALEAFTLTRTKRVRVQKDFAPLPAVRCRPMALRCAITNLVQNAVDALGDGPGTVTIETRATQGWIGIRVADDGPGIAPERLPSIFTPVLHRSGTRIRMGLGLAECRNIVEMHRGQIRLTSAPGEGTCVQMLIPAVEARPEHNAREPWRSAGALSCSC